MVHISATTPGAEKSLRRNEQSEPTTSGANARSESIEPNVNTWGIWRWMAQVYPHKWQSEYGPIPTAAWIAVLNPMSQEQLAYGVGQEKARIAKLTLAGREAWPPSAIAFEVMCRGSGDPAEVAARMPAHRALPEPEEAKAKRLATGTRALTAIYERMGWTRKVQA